MGARQRIILYNPRAVFWTMPLGLLAVASALDRERYEVEIVDGRLSDDPVAAVIAALDGALCLGIGVLTGAPIHDALAVTRAVAAARPELPIIWGGWHPSLFPTQTLHDEPAIRAIVAGQGEETFAELVERLSGGRDLEAVAGVTFRAADGAVVTNPPRPTQDVEVFPPLDYGMIAVEAYFERKARRQFDYISSVGCRFRCAFCADPYVYRRAWFGLSPERMAREIAGHREGYRFDEVAFQDETFFTRTDRVAGICDAFGRAGLDVAWTGTMRADQGHRLPDETLALCARAGLRRVMIGVEAGTDEMLKRIKKDITIGQVFETAEKLVAHGIGAIWNFIVGFPDEPADSLDATIEVAKRLRAMSPDFEAAIFFYKPYPGSEIADSLGAAGYRLPMTLAEWADFDYVGSAGSWVEADVVDRVERFKFYQRYAFGRHRRAAAPLTALARWRVARDFYRFPVERLLVERLHPPPRLS